MGEGLKQLVVSVVPCRGRVCDINYSMLEYSLIAIFYTFVHKTINVLQIAELLI